MKCTILGWDPHHTSCDRRRPRRGHAGWDKVSAHLVWLNSREPTRYDGTGLPMSQKLLWDLWANLNRIFPFMGFYHHRCGHFSIVGMVVVKRIGEFLDQPAVYYSLLTLLSIFL